MIKINNKGFTLVELIVVLVILAILAAILVPALLGYIDEAKLAQHKLNVKNVWTSAQTELVKLYAKNEYCKVDNDKQCVINRKDSSTKWTAKDFWNSHINIDESDVAKNIMEKCPDPCMVMIGLGSAKEYYNNDKKKAYTVYVICYQFEKDTQPFIWYNGEDISTDYPLVDFDTTNLKIKRNGEEIKLQFYCVKRYTYSNNTKKNMSDIWDNYIIPYYNK